MLAAPRAREEATQNADSCRLSDMQVGVLGLALRWSSGEGHETLGDDNKGMQSQPRRARGLCSPATLTVLLPLCY